MLKNQLQPILGSNDSTLESWIDGVAALSEFPDYDDLLEGELVSGLKLSNQGFSQTLPSDSGLHE